MKTASLFTVLVILFMLPWAVTLCCSNETIGMRARDQHVTVEGDSDVYDCLWHFWWIRTALTGGEDPRSYNGISLAWHNMGWPDLFISFITGIGYDLILLVGALFSATAGFLLARSWGLGKRGALLAGFIIAWMPVRVVRMYQHYPIASIGYVLMVMYFTRKWVLDGGWKNTVLLIVFSSLAVMETMYHGVTVVFGWAVSSFLMGRVYAKRSFLAGVIIASGFVLGVLWFFTAPGALGLNPGKDWKEAVFWAAEPQSYLLPSFLGTPVVTDYMPNDFEGVVTPGLTVALLAMFYCWRKRSWKAAAAVSAVVLLSMGPLLKFNGVPTPVPLPYMLLVKLPWLSAARAPARLAIIPGVMAAIAAGGLFEKCRPRVGWLIAGIIAVEILPLKLNTIPTAVPGFYSRETAGTMGITLEVPSSYQIRMYSLFAAVDHSPRTVKFLARGGESTMENIPESLRWGSLIPPDMADIRATGAETIVYNRWMFNDSVRTHYDLLYMGIFQDRNSEDSVWVWEAP